ncbi:uncharacterized protein EpC_12470 [Erwinia pyrifoliae Ep1/96]|nr:hypothetical protein CPI84_12460 [Erwinia pyrifoliae]CAX55026.1 uncharacterized protein EpC_12470 [Erwinia pyrifoliae Ep1/96]
MYFGARLKRRYKTIACQVLLSGFFLLISQILLVGTKFVVVELKRASRQMRPVSVMHKARPG